VESDKSEILGSFQYINQNWTSINKDISMLHSNLVYLDVLHCLDCNLKFILTCGKHVSNSSSDDFDTIVSTYLYTVIHLLSPVAKLILKIMISFSYFVDLIYYS
jgi:hypothetical protein